MNRRKAAATRPARRRAIPYAAVVAAVAIAVGTMAPQSARAGDELFPQSDLLTPAAEQAAVRGLAYLFERQTEDGAFRASRSGGNVAICGLAGMAMLASGSTPGRGPYGEALDRCLDYLLANVSESGVVLAPTATTNQIMYEHGFATLFLCECHGMAARSDLRDKISDAVHVIVGSQNEEGGWRYRPAPRDADVSVTVCQLMTLRAARNAGIAVPRETIDRGLDYVKHCQNDDGGFRYMLTAGEATSEFPRSAAGVVALYNAGVYHGAEIDRGLTYLDQFRPQAERENMVPHYFYAHYYAVQAMWHAGDERWRTWYPAIRDDLMSRQQEDGSWRDGIGSEYATAIACIVLLTPNNYLPILQR
ncbi:MAG: terpene cyclase/mutase family protein [Pirellulales bacterium]|nr:terpene cyclase/mutase family protein [Pirellulales bacterium]